VGALFRSGKAAFVPRRGSWAPRGCRSIQASSLAPWMAITDHSLTIHTACNFMLKTGVPLPMGKGKVAFWSGLFSSEANRSSCPMQTLKLERARRIAIHLTQRHGRGTPEFWYRLGLECDIAREMLRLEASVRRGNRGATFSHEAR
jgi:hypothetical protein